MLGPYIPDRYVLSFLTPNAVLGGVARRGGAALASTATIPSNAATAPQVTRARADCWNGSG